MKDKLTIVGIIICAFILRLCLLRFGNHADLIINAEWGKWIYEYGASGFYTNNIWIYGWPTQLPLINLLYAFNVQIYEELLWNIAYIGEVVITRNIPTDFFGWLIDLRVWFGTNLYAQTPFNNGFLVSMKILPILADLAIGGFIYMLRYKKSRKIATFVALLYLFFPFSWYESALWGQYDQLASLLAILAFSFLVWKKAPWLKFPISAIFMIAAFQIKPTILFLFLIYGLILLNQKLKFWILIATVMSGVIFIYLTFLPYFNGSLFIPQLKQIYSVVFNNDRYGLVNRAFNFWSLLSPNGGWSTVYRFLGVPALYWGWMAWVGFTVLGFMVYRKSKNFVGVLQAIFIVSGGVYIFTTGMVDRYLYVALVALAALVVQKPKLLVWWMTTGILFSINLFYSWGYPFITEAFVWGNILVIRLFSLMQTTVFVLLAYKIIKIKHL